MAQEVEKKRMFDVPGLPRGWKRTEVIRKSVSGISKGGMDVFYVSPNGRKFRTKPELSRYLGDKVDLSNFDFRTGKTTVTSLRKRVRHDVSLNLPIRQTASIFKQPVTMVRSHGKSRVKTDLKHGPQEQPKQLFWEKRLQNLRACDQSGEEMIAMELPRMMQGVGPEMTTENLLHSIATALHVNQAPVMGQTASRASLQKNPGVHVNPEQPLIQSLIVSEDEIRKQEARVRTARKRLEEELDNMREEEGESSGEDNDDADDEDFKEK